MMPLNLQSRPLSTIAAIVVAFLSSGWIIPLWLSGDSLIKYFLIEANGEDVMHSFPYLHFSRQSLFCGSTWLGVVVFIWAFLAISRDNSTQLNEEI